MKKEHYHIVVDKFNLDQYGKYNSKAAWADTPEELDAIWVNMYVISYGDGRGFCIASDHKAYRRTDIIRHLPTRELAEEVLQYARDTEILFI